MENICYTMGRLDVCASNKHLLHCKMAHFSIFGESFKAWYFMELTECLKCTQNWKLHISPVLAAISRRRQLTSSFVFQKSYDNYIPSGSWYIWHLENIDLHCCNTKHMDYSDQSEVWLLLSFSGLFSHCIINAAARSGGSYLLSWELDHR